MPETNAAQPLLEKYLRELQAGLRGLPPEEAREIADEIRSHILDSASESGQLSITLVQTTLDRLGPAHELASRYVMQSMAARAHSSGSHFLALKTIYRWARLSIAGFGAFFITLLGYGSAAVFAYAALAKPFAPHRIGLWRLPEPNDLSLSLGAVDNPAARELLGWWLIPIGLALATAFFFLTQRFVMWAIRRLRSSAVAAASMHEEQP
jgi:HAAS